MKKKPESKPGKPIRAARPISPVVPLTRGIPALARLLLFVRAGGRCQFDGGNKFLLEHPLTITEGNFAQMAHVVAFSPQGPRGEARSRRLHINNVTNLMLLCPQCHKLIDDHPDRYTVATLEKYQRQHEERIRHVTSRGPDLKTTVVQLKARVAGHSVAIPIAHVAEAVAPRYPTDARGHVIENSPQGRRPVFRETPRAQALRLNDARANDQRPWRLRSGHAEPLALVEAPLS